MKRRGFTLIELMVVIGIILVLVAIVVLGLRHVNNQAALRETQAEMVICQDLLKEYQNVNESSGIEGPSMSGGVPVAPTPFTMPPPWNFPIKFPVFFDASLEVTGGQPASALLTDDFAGHQNGTGGVFTTSRDMGDKLDIATARYYSNAVAWTQAVNFILMRDSKNRATVSASVPAKRILETPSFPQTSGTPQPASPYTLDAPIILDGWGNPIVYVPRGGMHVMLKQGQSILYEYVVRSSGTYVYPGMLPPLSANDRPFFASAGQDGVFTESSMNTGGADYAIDNIYSFTR
jgi:prepilin-type N-terminal cleavage/methylation domain-containing protein